MVSLFPNCSVRILIAVLTDCNIFYPFVAKGWHQGGLFYNEQELGQFDFAFSIIVSELVLLLCFLS